MVKALEQELDENEPLSSGQDTNDGKVIVLDNKNIDSTIKKHKLIFVVSVFFFFSFFTIYIQIPRD